MSPNAAESQKRGGAAVAEQHLVAVGQLEELGDSLAHATHDGLDGLAAVRRAHELGGRFGERGDRFLADLRRSGAEAAVAREQRGREHEV